MSDAVKAHLQNQIRKLQNSVSNLQQANGRKSQRVQALRNAKGALGTTAGSGGFYGRKRGMGDGGAAGLYNQMAQLPAALAPMNVGDINDIIWPFFFTHTKVEVSPTSPGAVANISITQEAAFICTHLYKAVHLVTGVTPNRNYAYMDPEDYTGASQSTGLNFNFQDSSSQRFFAQAPFALELIGRPLYPTKLDVPLLFQPQANIQVTYSLDTSQTGNSYAPFVVMFGIRCRINQAQQLIAALQQSGNGS